MEMLRLKLQEVTKTIGDNQARTMVRLTGTVRHIIEFNTKFSEIPFSY